MKKVLRVLGFIIVTPLCIYWIILGGFHLKEYVKGNSYVAYLNKNKTVLDTDFNLDSDFYEHQLFIVGELHGFAKSPEIDFKLFKHLNEKTGVRYYMSEVDYSQAYFLNKYLKTGQDSIIDYALKNWLVVQAKGNKDYYQKWKNLYAFNKTLPKEEQIVVLGCDELSDKELLVAHLKELLNKADFQMLFEDSSGLKEFREKIKGFNADDVLKDSFREKYKNKSKELEHLFTTVLQTEEGYREQKIFSNFQKLYELHQLENEKIYSFYGFYHTLQAKTANGFEPLASRIKNSDLAHANSMVSLNMCYQDSKMIMASDGLPGFLQTGPEWSEVSFKYDSLLLFYLEGIKDLIRTSKENSTTVYKMDAENSPYFKTNRLMSIKMLLPFLESQKIEIDQNMGTADYAQYLIFIRNSKAAQPL